MTNFTSTDTKTRKVILNEDTVLFFDYSISLEQLNILLNNPAFEFHGKVITFFDAYFDFNPVWYDLGGIFCINERECLNF